MWRLYRYSYGFTNSMCNWGVSVCILCVVFSSSDASPDAVRAAVQLSNRNLEKAHTHTHTDTHTPIHTHAHTHTHTSAPHTAHTPHTLSHSLHTHTHNYPNSPHTHTHTHTSSSLGSGNFVGQSPRLRAGPCEAIFK